MKFKNTDWSVSGSKHLLEAFGKDLEEAGLKLTKSAKSLVCFEESDRLYYSEDKCMVYLYHKVKEKDFTLPEQYNEALEYATEKEQKLEVGKWYIDGRFLFHLTKKGFDQGCFFAYGIAEGEWQEESCIDFDCYNWRDATKEEVEKALIAEFERTLKGKSFKPLKLSILGMYKEYEYRKGRLYYRGDCVFSEGKWAEVLAEQDKVPVITVNGTDYKMEFEGDYIKFGCAYIFKGDLINLYNILTDKLEGFGYNAEKANRTIKSITLDSGVEITVEKLKEIKEYLENN